MKTIDEIVITGNLSELTAEQRVEYYKMYCESIGVDWRRMPLGYIQVDDDFSGRKTILYALRNCSDQLREVHQISITKLEREQRDGYIAYKAYAVDHNGRTDIAVGAVSTAGKTGQALANADMHADTKARRRVTLDICGVGLLDETEITDLNSKTEVVSTPGLELKESSPLPAPSSAPGAPLAVLPESVKTAIDDLKSAIADIPSVSPIADIPPSGAPLVLDSGEMPTPKEQEAFAARMAVYRNEILPKGGLVSSAGLGVNGKIKRFFMIVTGAKDSKSMTKLQWETTLSFLDGYVAQHGPEGLVKYVDEKVA